MLGASRCPHDERLLGLGACPSGSDYELAIGEQVVFIERAGRRAGFWCAESDDGTFGRPSGGPRWTTALAARAWIRARPCGRSSRPWTVRCRRTGEQLMSVPRRPRRCGSGWTRSIVRTDRAALIRRTKAAVAWTRLAHLLRQYRMEEPDGVWGAWDRIATLQYAPASELPVMHAREAADLVVRTWDRGKIPKKVFARLLDLDDALGVPRTADVEAVREALVTCLACE